MSGKSDTTGGKIRDRVEIIHRPNLLGEEAARPGGIGPQEAIRRAEAVLSGMTDDHRDAVDSDIFRLEALAAGLSGTTEMDADDFARLFSLAYNLKGRGATFGFPAVSAIASSLLGYLEKVEDSRLVKSGIVSLHAEALTSAMTDGGKTDNREQLDRLLKSFREMIDKAV